MRMRARNVFRFFASESLVRIFMSDFAGLAKKNPFFLDFRVKWKVFKTFKHIHSLQNLNIYREDQVSN